MSQKFLVKLYMENMPKLSPYKAWFWIALSTLLISGPATIGCWYYLNRASQLDDDQYRIIAIVQTTADKEVLKTVYLAELLYLSVDCPTNLHRFNAEEARQRLLNSVVIKEASIKKVLPGTIYVDYTMRKPIAYLEDYTNTAIDEEGVLFPVSPFFTPKNLPKIRLGINEVNHNVWGTCYRNHRAFQCVLELLKKNWQDEGLSIKFIDVSRTTLPSYGKREMILAFEKGGGNPLEPVCFLRLNANDYTKGLVSYRNLIEHLKERKAAIIDLRIPNLALVDLSHN